MAAGDETAAEKVDAGGIVLTVLLVGMLYLMVFKPRILIAAGRLRGQEPIEPGGRR